MRDNSDFCCFATFVTGTVIAAASAAIDWKKIRHSVEITALISIMAAGYLAPALVWSAPDRTLQLSPCSCEEAIASDDEDHKVSDCDHLKPFSVADAGIG